MNQSGIYHSKQAFHLSDDSLKVKLNGKKLSDFEKFYPVLKRKLKFPDYFGNNLDALEECLNDLSWLSTKQLIIKIESSSDLLSDEDQQDRDAIWGIVKDAAEFWQNEDLEFIVLKL